jgi:peptidoglycan/xylan/chitin deacetylase (PgdA/CDA1 family)
MRWWQVSGRRRLLVLVGAALVIALVAAGGIAVAKLGPGGAGTALTHSSPELVTPGPSLAPDEPSPGLRSTDRAIIPAGRATIRVPILEYHYIRDNPNPRDQLGFRLSVTPTEFQRQMDWLAANSYHPVSMADLRAYFAAGRPLPATSVVLTFDDGYLDFFTTAFPILQRLGFTAVAYVVPGFLGRPGYMDQAQIQQLDASGIVEIASHTVNHLDLTRLDAGSLNTQLQASRASLEQLLGHPVLDFCYPSGRFNGRVVSAVAAAGYQTATTELPGTEHDWSGRLTWSRVRVDGGEGQAQFALRLGSPETPVTSTSPLGNLTRPQSSAVQSGAAPQLSS